MESLSPTISIPLIPYFCNVVVFPGDGNTSPVFILKKTAVTPQASKKILQCEYLPGHAYALLPSKEMFYGEVSIYQSRPEFLKDFSYCSQVDPKEVVVDCKLSKKFDMVPSQDSFLTDSPASVCKMCFVSHFPRPNTKLCKGYNKTSALKSNSEMIWPIRLRGGAKVDESLEDMKKRAINNASFHGISIHPGVENLGNGNCAFETVLDSINTRQCFNDKFEGAPNYWRNIWMTEVEKIAMNDWKGSLSEAEWHEGWSILKKPGTYEHRLGDLVLPGIAHCTKKDILIFNTNPSAHRPVYVVEASSLCNQAANTEVPICLAYNQTHYEAFVPDSDEDIMKTILLKEQFVKGIYNFTMDDVFASSKEPTAPVSIPSPNLGPPPCKKTKKLSPAEKKRRYRENRSEEKKMEELSKNRLRNATKRKTQTNVERQEKLERNRNTLAEKRKKQTKDERLEELEKERCRKAMQRENQTEKRRQAAQAMIEPEKKLRIKI